jgi:hypothetical protein
VTVRMHRGTGAAPKCPELPGVLKALFDRLQQSDGGPSLWSQLEEALGIVPRRIDADTAATPTVPVLSPHCAAKIRRTARRRAPGGAQHAVSFAPLRRIFTHASTGPPTGPPAASGYQILLRLTNGAGNGWPRRPDSRAAAAAPRQTRCQAPPTPLVSYPACPRHPRLRLPRRRGWPPCAGHDAGGARGRGHPRSPPPTLAIPRLRPYIPAQAPRRCPPSRTCDGPALTLPGRPL